MSPKGNQHPVFANGLFSPPQTRQLNYLSQEAVYRVVEQNELAYDLVASTGSLLFDLTESLVSVSSSELPSS